jgi:hypothetical protein
MVLRPGNSSSAGRQAHLRAVLENKFPAEAIMGKAHAVVPPGLRHCEMSFFQAFFAGIRGMKHTKTLPKLYRFFTKNLFLAI